MNEREIMKSWKAKIQILLCGLIVQMGLSLCLAHDNKTMHPLISDSAAKSSAGLPNFLTECFGYSLAQSNLSYSDPDGANGGRSPLEWIKAGSHYEDVPWWRGNNHFYPATFATTPIVTPAEAVSIVGNHLQVTIKATDYCRDHVGWQSVSITWRAFSVPP